MALTPEARQTFTRLFGTEPTPHPTDPELLEILQNEIFGEVFATPGLTDAEREMLTVAVLAAMQTLPQLRAHLGAALNTGLTPLQLRETIYQCAPYIGWPKTLNAVGTLGEALTAAGVKTPLEPAGAVAYEDREAAGAAIQTPLYGEEVKEVFAALPEPYGEFLPHLLTSNAFGDIETRGVLDVPTRELIVLVVVVAFIVTVICWARPPSSGRMSPAPSEQATAGSRSPQRSSRCCPTSADPMRCPVWLLWRATTRTPPRRPTAEALGGPSSFSPRWSRAAGSGGWSDIPGAGPSAGIPICRGTGDDECIIITP